MLALLLPLALAQEPAPAQELAPAAPADAAPPDQPADANTTDPIYSLDGICSGPNPFWPSLEELRGREIQQHIALFMTGGTTWDGHGRLLTASGVTADHVAILVDGVLVEGRSARWTRFR